MNALKTFGNARNDQHCTIVGVEPELPTPIEEVLRGLSRPDVGFHFS